MPMKRDRYPKNWEQIARRTKQSANWHCEACGKPCLLMGEDWLDFILRLGWNVGEAIAAAAHPTRHVLTTAHPNHDPENLEAELRAWCAPCHCRYDLAQMPRKKRLELERRGQLTIDLLTAPEPAGQGKDPTRIQLPIRRSLADAT